MDLLTVQQASALIGIPDSTLRYWRSVNQGPPSFKVGSRIMFSRRGIEIWLANQEAATSRGDGAA